MAEHTGRTGSDPVAADLSIPLADDVTLHVIHRQGSLAPAFLLVHGLAGNARVWDEVAGPLSAAGHAVYAVDLRGHGDTEAPEDDHFGTATAAEDLAAVCGSLGLTGAVVAGHSWGADVSLFLAGTHPELVAGLALVDGGYTDARVFYSTWESFTAMASLGEPNGATVDDMRDYLHAVHPDWSARAVEASLSCLRIAPDGTLSPRLSQRRRTTILRGVWNTPPSGLYQHVTQPVLLMPATPVADSDRIAADVRSLFALLRSSLAKAIAALPHATVREYPGADHDLHAQHPRRVAADLLEFARTVRQRRADDIGRG